MTQKKEVYKCEICGNIVEVLHEGPGELVCCGQPMKKMEEKDNEEGLNEKHIPVIEEAENKIIVKIGEVEHPMTEEHYIEWVELETENEILRKYLSSGEKPEVSFEKPEEKITKVRSYCNLHELWTKTLE